MATAGTCGTGSWSGPKPGDPSNIYGLSAVGDYGGIKVTWNLPGVNPHALAFTSVYRGATADFDSALLLWEGNATGYHDDIPDELAGVTYYYWIRQLSVNGTEGDLVGPASAAALPSIDRMIELLTGRIDSGVLATALRSEIGLVHSLGTSITEEITNRLAEVAALSAALGELQTGLTNAITVVEQTQSQQITDNAALVNALNLYAAGFNGSIAGVAEDVQAVATDLTALAGRTTTVEATVNGDTATGEVGLVAKVETVDGKVTDIGALYTAKVGVNGLIGGFGIYNDGSEVEAGFDVDTLWIGRTGPDKKKPFIISGGVVYLNTAVIADASIGFAKLYGDIESDNYVAGVSGWKLTRATGDAEVNDLTARGNITADNINGQIVNTEHILNNAISAANFGSGSGATVSTNLVVPAGETWKILVIGFQAGMAYPVAEGFSTLSIPGASTAVPIVTAVSGVDTPVYTPVLVPASVCSVVTATAGTYSATLTGFDGAAKQLVLIGFKK